MLEKIIRTCPFIEVACNGKMYKTMKQLPRFSSLFIVVTVVQTKRKFHWTLASSSGLFAKCVVLFDAGQCSL